MILVVILLILLGAGLFAWLSDAAAARWIAVAALAIDLALSLALWLHLPASFDAPWLPLLGARLHLYADGLSAVLLVLTMALGLCAVASGWREIDRRVGFFHFALLWCLAGVAGVFVAADLLLFYFFWELMLVPMVLMIGIWGHGERVRAALKFAIFTQAGGLCLLLATIALAVIASRRTGVWSFDYAALIGQRLPRGTELLLMLGFCAAFLVKLPAVPLHTWLADAHTEAPTPGSVVLAGLLLKTGAYGLLRFALPLFPTASRSFAPVGMALGAIGAVYGAWLALCQTDLKRLVAYTSVSHMGLALLGVYALSPRGLCGVVLQLVCHGLATGGMFVAVGALTARTGVRDLRQLGGLWRRLPVLSAATTVLALASLGLPGLGSFAAELLLLLAALRAQPVAGAVAAASIVLATIYALRFIQRPFHGRARLLVPAAADLDLRERAALFGLCAALAWIGLWPMQLLHAAGFMK